MNTQSLEPTDLECRSVLERFPTLTESGFYPYEVYQRENDRRAANGLPHRVHRPPASIATPGARRQIALARLFIREVQGDKDSLFPPGFVLSIRFRAVVAQWAGERISNGAVIAAALLEGCAVFRQGQTASALLAVSIPPALYDRLAAVTHTAIANMNGALACAASNAGLAE
jgi:hypothetical protein